MSPLRLVECADCEQAQTRLDTALAQINDLRLTNEGLGHQIASLMRQLGAKRKRENDQTDDPDYEMAVKVFDFWRERCGHPRAVLGPKRLKAILARLKDHEPRLIGVAIKGAAVAAFVDENGHRHDDIELICRDEVKLDSFINRYEQSRESGKT